jgi:quinol monooxygenase YgiN
MYGKLIAHPGKRDDLVKILLEAAEMLEANENCEMYIVNIPDNDPNSVWVTELWKDAEAHAASLTDARVLELLKRGRPLIAGAEPIRLHPVGGKGI